MTTKATSRKKQYNGKFSGSVKLLLATLKAVKIKASESLQVVSLGAMRSLNVKLLKNGKLQFIIQWPQIGGEDECRTFTYSPRDPETFTDADLIELVSDAKLLADDMSK